MAPKFMEAEAVTRIRSARRIAGSEIKKRRPQEIPRRRLLPRMIPRLENLFTAGPPMIRTTPLTAITTAPNQARRSAVTMFRWASARIEGPQFPKATTGPQDRDWMNPKIQGREVKIRDEEAEKATGEAGGSRVGRKKSAARRRRLQT